MNAFPDSQLIEDVAIELGVDASFIEKDWHAVRLLALLSQAEHGDFALVFSGGTSLSKGFGLIQRFSEDLDFKVMMPKKPITKMVRKAFREQIFAEVNRSEDLKILESISRNEGRFACCLIEYPNQFKTSAALRSQLKLEITFESPRLPVVPCAIRSFVAEALGEAPEVPVINCISPVETAADKLSALSWRVLSRDRASENDDATLIRHLYDIAALEGLVNQAEAKFAALIETLVQRDIATRCRGLDLPQITGEKFVQMALEQLQTDAVYAEEYQRFVNGMSYAAEDEMTTFEQALAAMERLTRLVN